MSLRDGLFLLMVTPLYFQPVRNLAAAYHERAEAFAAIEALAPLLSDSQASHVANVSPVQVERPPTVLLRDVDVKFDGREAPALDGVTLSVQAGELIGVSGPSGAGKSTLLRLVAGDLAPSEGSVTIDEAPAVDVERTSVTWLGQRPYLFSGTLADNIRLGRQDASVDAIRVAALNAGLDAVLDRLGEGLETRVGEGGWGLSGGETHRISLARTFLNPSSLLLLDEPTAHLDAESELAIIETITELARGATTIVVTHSPALLAICDRVLALDRGRLVERGVTAALSGSSA
jgi:ABC-type transport system involved in cytochrome bd biosynthesis fused ATPase/permease subunit